MSPKTRQSTASSRLTTASNLGSRTRAARRSTVLPTRSSARLSISSRLRNGAATLNYSTSAQGGDDTSIITSLSMGVTFPESPSNSSSAMYSAAGRVEEMYPSARESDAADVSVVDLASPSPTPRNRTNFRQPLEVDLTCDVDEEVFVVLEDIVNPRRRDNDLPIILGSSPPAARHIARRNRRVVLQSSSRSPTHSRVDEVSDSTASSADLPPSPQEQDHSRGIHCPICLESLAQIKSSNRQLHSTTCGHLFCNSCITRALASMPQCPTCRQPLTTRKIHPIFI